METRPQRRDGVELLGEMPAAGYAERQWLVQDRTRFLQLSELPYRVLDLADGNRTVDQMAAELTLMTEWSVQDADVQRLLEKLRLLGLIDGEDAFGHPPVDALKKSPLQLSLRVKMLPPRLVAGLTNIFQHFYSPWFLIPMAVLIAISHWWLYRGHAIRQSIESVLYQPGGLLAVVGLAVIAGLFHEVGHASALRYGGGRPRGIGFGLYLVYPAFYSDVTDAYRLGRAARIRTDLGGIYFHLIFAFVLIAVSVFTGSAFLVAAALIFNIEALRQFIPFVRLDGYWLLADLTGIPDLFSQAVPFARRLWPRRFKGEKLPALKPWARNVFAVYLLITIPVLIYAFVRMLLYAPTLVQHTMRALAFQVGLITQSASWATWLLSGTQMLLLSVPLAATVYFLYSVAVPALGTIGRRHLSARAIRLAAAPVCAAILLLAVTALGWTGAPNDKGTRLLAETRATIERMRTLEADVHGAIGGDEFHGRVSLSRPNRAHIEIAGGDAVGVFNVIADGQSVFVNFPASQRYTVARAAKDGRNINAFVVDQVRMFFLPERLTSTAPGEHVRYVGREQIGGETLDVIEVAPAHAQGVTWRYFISHDRLVRRVVASASAKEGQPAIRWVQLENPRVNRRIAEQAFQWTPSGKTLGLGDLDIDLSARRQVK
jgi:putative peptide zinc metalloprotease protein